MKCSLLTLSCALDGELSRERQAELDAHLITCERCRTGMRYLREETERISVLAQVSLHEETATALLERSRVLASAGPATLPPPPAVEAVDQMRLAPDPFGTIGLDTAILEVPDRPAADGAANLEQETQAVAPELENGSSAEATAADLAATGEASPVPEELWLARPGSDPELFESSPVASEEAAEAALADDADGAQGFSADNAFLTSPMIAGEPEPAPPAVDDQATKAEEVAAEAPASDAADGPQGFSADDAFLTAPTIAEDGEQAPPPVGYQAEEIGDSRPSTIVVPGWEPATTLDVSWAEIPSAQPSDNTWGPGLAGVPVQRSFPPLPPDAPFPAASTPTRPAAAAIPGMQVEGGPWQHQPERSSRNPDGGYRRPARTPAPSPSPEPRSWARTGLIAVAALAIVLIGWNLLHGGSKPVAAHHPTGQATAAAKPSPSSTPTPTAAPTPVALSGVQSVGSAGSGYQLQTVRYGVHGSQFWVVFQMIDGSGTPKVTAGFDGSDTLYVEMHGVAPGTQVPQPASGQVVSSITVGHVPGFSGAVYILHLTRPVQLSPSLLPGTDSGGAGERYLAILQ
jgi:anti-sigma factor RsiW